MSKKQQHTSLIQAFKFAGAGIANTVKQERNIKIEIGIASLALVLGFVLALQPLEWVAVIVLITLVLALELTNSALESMIDLVNPEQHPLAKYSKDAMAAAVLIAAFCSLVCGCIIFISAALRMWGA